MWVNDVKKKGKRERTIRGSGLGTEYPTIEHRPLCSECYSVGHERVGATVVWATLTTTILGFCIYPKLS